MDPSFWVPEYSNELRLNNTQKSNVDGKVIFKFTKRFLASKNLISQLIQTNKQ